MNDQPPRAMPAVDDVCSRAGRLHLDIAAARISGIDISMDISRDEQRVLHALAQGGRIAAIKNEAGKITGLEFFSRDGWLMNNCSLTLFKKLKAKKAIASAGGKPYRITRRGLELVRSQLDNR